MKSLRNISQIALSAVKPFLYAMPVFIGLSFSAVAPDYIPDNQPPLLPCGGQQPCNQQPVILTMPKFKREEPSKTIENPYGSNIEITFVDLTKIQNQGFCQKNSLEAKLNDALRGVEISLSHLPTQIDYPLGEQAEDILSAEGHKIAINVSGIAPLTMWKNAGISATGDLEGFIQPIRYSLDDEFYGEGATYGITGELGAKAAGILHKTLLYASVEGGAHMYVFDGGQCADGTLDNQAISGLNWNASAGFETFAGKDSTLSLSIDGKGIGDVNDESSDLRWKNIYGVNASYTDEKRFGLEARLAGEKEAGDQTSYTHVFYNAKGEVTFSSIAKLFNKDGTYPQWMDKVRCGIGYSGAVHMSGPEVKYAEDDTRGGFYVGLSGDTEFGTFSATADFHGQLKLEYKSN